MAELVQATNHSVLHRFPHRYPSPISTYHLPFILSLPISITRTAKSSKLPVSASSFNQTGSEHQILSPLGAKKELLTVKYEHVNGEFGEKASKKQRVFFLDVNPLCYKNGSPSLQSFAHWIKLFFSQVSLGDPVIAVFDGDGGNEYRRQILPSYKAKRRKFSTLEGSSRSTPRRWQDPVMDTLKECNVPVVKIDGHEADDVVATFVEQVLRKGYRAVIASPDKDFKQLISEDVQIVMPLPDLDRWSFYTLKHYAAQYTCEPQCDLSLRCILGDEIDGIPGLQHVAPAFGRKTALKLLKKHGTLENLLSAASVRTVGKQYAQEALTTHADFLRRNYRVLSLRRDLDIHIEEQWLSNRDAKNDPEVLSSFANLLGEMDTKWQNPVYQVKWYWH